jgi:hypothetical protein
MVRPLDRSSSSTAQLVGPESGGKASARAYAVAPSGGSSSGSGQYPRSSANAAPDSRSEARSFDERAPGVRTLARIVLSPGSEMLEATHAFATSYVASRLHPQVAQRVSLAAYELIANALSYSTMSEDIGIEILESDRLVAIRVSNQTIAARISMLSEHIAKLRANPEQTLTDEMRRSVAGGPRPMLGLARIVHEVGMHLDVSIEDRRVTLTSSCKR